MVVRIGQKSAKPRQTFFGEWRKYCRLTQPQLAERLHTTKGAVSKMENGRSKYNQSTLEAWADALGREPGELLGPPPPPDGESELERARRMLERARPEDRKKVVAVIEAMLKVG
jgi:transcriptional regulator with XRE-family HTH domain